MAPSQATRTENPTLAALIEAAPPPSSNKAEAQDSADQEGTAGGAVTNTDPISQTVRIDLAIQSEAQAEAINEDLEEEFEEEEEDLPDVPSDILQLPGFEFFDAIGDVENGALFQGAVAAAIYFDMVGQVNVGGGGLPFPGFQMIHEEFEHRLSQRLNYNGNVNTVVNEVIAYGDSVSEFFNQGGYPSRDHLRAILSIVDNFCKNKFPNDQVKIQICRECFTDAVVFSFSSNVGKGRTYLEYLMGNLDFN